ncbi:uncharacterized protein [Palaemon carinicauda]|uniref:uncharacterized protein n=1 Tax=Palaemon carinicauda TaxID=392227 RepID=UPI0035B6816E
MTSNRSLGGLDEIDQLCLKVTKIVKSEARIILYYIWNKGCIRDLNKTFEDHAKYVLNWSNRKYNNAFDKTMQDVIKNNPKGEQFDVSLLYACIFNTCDKFTEDEKKQFFLPIKFFRNNVMHSDIVKDEVTMDNAIEEIRELLKKALNKAKEVYSLNENDINDMIKHMEGSIKDIKESPVLLGDIDDYRLKVKQHREALENIVEEKGVPSLKTIYKDLSNVDPASWISGKERLDIQMVYIQLEMIIKLQGSQNSCISVGHENLLCLKNEQDKVPTIILVEGEAGSGKSTLAKFILADWAKLDASNHQPSIKGLDNYDLVLYVECKNRNISNFVDLLTTLMLQVSYEMTDRDFKRSVLKKTTLIVVDGLDEINENSEKLLTEMLDTCLKMSSKLHFIITTRPQKVRIAEKMCRNIPKVHIKIKGIPTERREEFVQKLHDEMIKEGLSHQDTSKLKDYMKISQNRLGDHYRLPLNLTLLTYLWANDPNSVNSVTSATQLYIAVLDLIKSRVISRISPILSDSTSTSIEKLVCVLYEIYSETHKRESLELDEKSYKKLANKCEELDLPFDEICGAFFSVDNWSWTHGPVLFLLSAPHKSIMEFFTANHIYACLVEDRAQQFEEELQNLRMSFPDIVLNYQLENNQPPRTLKRVLANLLNDGKDLNPNKLPHYLNTLVHLAGLLALRDVNALHKYGNELVDVIEAAEIEDFQWLDLLAEAECDPILSSSIAERISLALEIRDGHTIAAIELFNDLPTNIPVVIILQNEVKYIPQLDKLMEKLAERDCPVELLLKNHWKNPDNGLSTQYLKKLYGQSCRVTHFIGNLDDVKILPKDLEEVKLTIANDSQAISICNGITKLNEELELTYIGIHVMKGVSPKVLKPLPVVKPVSNESGTIWLSNINDDDVVDAAQVIKALYPDNMKFQSIMFPRCELSLEGFQHLLTNLNKHKVKISKTVKSDSKVLALTDVPTVRTLCKDLFNCSFYWEEEWQIW